MRAPRRKEVLWRPNPVERLWGVKKQNRESSEWAGGQKIALTTTLVELTGFEPVTPSLRKMWSNRCDQVKRYAPAVL
jgi:hypothetical protein